MSAATEDDIDLAFYLAIHRGYGWEDIIVECPSLTQAEAWDIVKEANRNEKELRAHG